MKKIIYSPGKINLALDVCCLRQDDYHEIESVVFPISLCDKIELDFEKEDFQLQTSFSEIKITSDNFIVQIIREMEKIWHFKANVNIFIHKNIPLMAGLGGGSSNAASIMKELVDYFQLDASNEELTAIGQKYSCDIPFFIYNKPALVQSAGEKVFPIETDFKCSVLLIKPFYGISSIEAYKSVIPELCEHPHTHDLLDGLRNMQYEKVAASIGNSFLHSNPILSKEYRILAPLLTQLGFDAVSLSGTGSCFFALTQSRATLLTGYNILKKKYPFVKYTSIPYIY